ncbi:MAG: hypothetical protein ABI430_02705 [Candidatus Taylorbacteria bacterium]
MILMLSVFFIPWWVVLGLGICFLFYFDSFVEILILGFMIDSVYNVSSSHYLHFQFIISLLSVVLFVFSTQIKKRLTIYKN